MYLSVEQNLSHVKNVICYKNMSDTDITVNKNVLSLSLNKRLATPKMGGDYFIKRMSLPCPCLERERERERETETETETERDRETDRERLRESLSLSLL